MQKQMNKRNETLWQRLKSYKLHYNIYVLLVLLVAVVLSTLVFYHLYTIEDQGFLFNLMIAVATSLLASVFCMISDLILKYKECENDKLIKGLHEYGIGDLHFDKQELLRVLLDDCRREFWISGYRLILTRKLIPGMRKAIKRNVKLRILVSPPWNEAYKLIYGENDRVIDNYYKVLGAVLLAAGSAEQADKLCEVRVTAKPLFNDTYKIDDYLVTGSYMHNKDSDHGRITASDFFTFDLVRKSALYSLIEDEYQTLWDEADERLQWDAFEKMYAQDENEDLRESERIENLHSCCAVVPGNL